MLAGTADHKLSAVSAVARDALRAISSAGLRRMLSSSFGSTAPAPTAVSIFVVRRRFQTRGGHAATAIPSR